MASYTTNLNLRKIDGADAPPDITVLNQNWDTLDQTIENKMNKHLLQYDGDIKENGVRLTFPVLYDMLLNKPEFVVLVNDGEALHPNIVNNEEIVFVSVDPDNTGLSGRKVTMTNDGYSTVTLEENTSVPSTRKVNNKELSSDISLTSTDVGALPMYTTSSSYFSDFNNCKQNGFYRITSEKASSTANSPFPYACAVYVFSPQTSATEFGDRGIQLALRTLETNAELKWRKWNGNLWSEWKTVANADEFLPLSGGTLTGTLKIDTTNPYLFFGNNSASALYGSADGNVQLEARNTNSGVVDVRNRRLLNLRASNYGTSGTNLNSAIRLVDLVDNVTTSYMLYGQHNKPTGKYVGNGSSTARTINVGGLGGTLFLTSEKGCAYVSAHGAFCWGGTVYSGTPYYYSGYDINLRSGVLNIATTLSYFNENGVTYSFELL